MKRDGGPNKKFNTSTIFGKKKKEYSNTWPLFVLNLTSRMAGLLGPAPSARAGSRGETAGAKSIQEIGRPT